MMPGTEATVNLFDYVNFSVDLDGAKEDLRREAAQRSGAEGALWGGLLGAVTALTAAQAAGRPVDGRALLTGAAMGAVYGVADKRLVRGE